MSKPKNAVEIQLYVEQVANHRHWLLNPDRELTDSIVQGLLSQTLRTGGLLCPCRDSWSDTIKDRDILCPCQYAPMDIDQYGQCFCGLFLNPLAPPAEVTSIPERRDQKLFP